MAVQIWWLVLSIAAFLNIVAWGVSTLVLARRHENFFAAPHYRDRRLLMWLSGAYVAGCAFRSVLPRIDLERVCLVQTWLSSMVVGRSVATIAELCFMAQCALLLNHAGRGTNTPVVILVSGLLIPIIVVAEGASWYAILSTNYFGHVLENSLWTFSALLVFASCLALWPYSKHTQRRFLAFMMVFAVGYVAFMISIDVPMYWARWRADLAAGTKYLTLTQGIVEASQSCLVRFDWAIWHDEIAWMTLYFTVAVWVSISLAHVPGWMNGSSTITFRRSTGVGGDGRAV